LQEVANVCGSRKKIQVIISHFKPTHRQVSEGEMGKGWRLLSLAKGSDISVNIRAESEF